MSSNRFDFLELVEEPDDEGKDSSAGVSAPFGPAHLREPDEETLQAAEEARVERADPPPRRRIEAGDYAPSEFYQSKPVGPLNTYQKPEATKRAADEHDLRAVEVFGTRGAAVGQFNFPRGIAVDRTGILFVADAYNHRVQRITPDGGVAIVGSRGSGRTQFLAPMGVAVDQELAFYVVEQGNHRVQKFSAEGTLEMVFGKAGGRPGEFRSPMGITVSAATGEILVADTGNARVQRFSMSGKFIGALGAAGSVQPALSNPQSVACDYLGNIYVADTLANRIARYDPLGRFTGHFGGVLIRGTSIAPNVRFTEPHALACGTEGNLFIADGDHGPGRLVMMSSDIGAVKCVVEDPGRGLGKLQRPGGVALSPLPRTGYADGRPRSDVYLADTMNHRIIRFTCA